jgi:chromate reductase
MSKKKIAVLVGSLRKNGFNSKLANELIAMVPETLQMELITIGDLPLYNDELETEVPASWTRIREQIAQADGVLFITPEYNRSTSGALKNAIDVVSRPWGNNKWNNKPGAVISTSPGPLGGFGANHHIRQMAACINIPMMQQPEAYIGNIHTIMDENGKINNPDSIQFLKNFLQAFEAWVNRF